MRLLVSVRVPEEVDAALAGGADIIDAKEPAHGSLGSVAPEVLARIGERIPGSVPLSVALGDATNPHQLGLLVRATALPERRAETLAKVGFADRPAKAIKPIIRTGLQAAAQRGMVLVPVAYADHANAGSLPPGQILDAASASGARAFLIDTYLKNGGSLLSWIDLAVLARLANQARQAGMLFALAGSLDGPELEAVAGIADVVGVRGAACRGGRSGVVDAALVRALRERLSASVPVLGSAL